MRILKVNENKLKPDKKEIFYWVHLVGIPVCKRET